jgi:hypothetical protein
MTSPRQFRSRIGGDFACYLALKRALGRKYDSEEKLLRNLDGFLASRFPAARELSVAILETWMATSPILPQTRAVRLRIVRQFCLYCRRMAPNAFVPDRIRHRWLWPQHVTRCVPNILSKEQVRELLRAALALPDRRASSASSRPHHGGDDAPGLRRRNRLDSLPSSLYVPWRARPRASASCRGLLSREE